MNSFDRLSLLTIHTLPFVHRFSFSLGLILYAWRAICKIWNIIRFKVSNSHGMEQERFNVRAAMSPWIGFRSFGDSLKIDGI